MPPENYSHYIQAEKPHVLLDRPKPLSNPVRGYGRHYAEGHIVTLSAGNSTSLAEKYAGVYQLA